MFKAIKAFDETLRHLGIIWMKDLLNRYKYRSVFSEAQFPPGYDCDHEHIWYMLREQLF